MDALDNLLHGLIVLRPYATGLAMDERSGLCVTLAEGTVLHEVSMAVLRQAGWSSRSSPDGTTQAWVFD